jgi:hypothetical protein
VEAERRANPLFSLGDLGRRLRELEKVQQEIHEINTAAEMRMEAMESMLVESDGGDNDLEAERQANPAVSPAELGRRRIKMELFQQEIHAAHERRVEAMESMLAETDSEDGAGGD